jgi:hypothetical protein
MKGNAITLGAAAAKFAMLEVACCRCEAAAGCGSIG